MLLLTHHLPTIIKSGMNMLKISSRLLVIIFLKLCSCSGFGVNDLRPSASTNPFQDMHMRGSRGCGRQSFQYGTKEQANVEDMVTAHKGWHLLTAPAQFFPFAQDMCCPTASLCLLQSQNTLFVPALLKTRSECKLRHRRLLQISAFCIAIVAQL